MNRINRMSGKINGIVCAAGDRVAMGIMDKARDLGVKIPADIALIGHDDFEHAEHLQLTTIRMPAIKMGKKAFEMAVNAIENPKMKPQHIIYKPELVIRKTT